MAVVLLGGYVWWDRYGAAVPQGESRRGAKKSLRKDRSAADSGKQDRQDSRRKKQADESSYSPADKKLSDAIQSALEDEDFSAVAAAAERAMKSSNPEVRREAVDALGWFGEKALAELTVWMADADEDVAQAATSHWEDGVADIEEADERLKVSLFAINTITDRDALEVIGSQFANAATELIDGEEDETRAAQKRQEVLQALVDMIEDGKPAHAAAAREIYEDVTGNKWISIDEAEKWLRDPDSYEEPDGE